MARLQGEILDRLSLDIVVLTEPPPALVGQPDVVTSPPLRPGRHGPEAWVAIRGDGICQVDLAIPFERLATAAAVTVGSQTVIVYGSVLPWRSAPLHLPDIALPGETAPAMFERLLQAQLSELRRLRADYPDALVIWAGDFNQSLDGPNLVGSARGRDLLLGALAELGLAAWNRLSRHAVAGLCAIDLICGSEPDAARTVEWVDPCPDGVRLSDHAGYVVDLQ